MPHGVIPHPLPEVNFLMVEIPTPKPYIFMIRVNRQIKCPKSWGPGHPQDPYQKFFLRITHISETILSILTKLCPNVPWVILFQSYVWYVWGPKKGPRGGLKWLIIIVLIVRCFKKTVYFLFFHSYDFITVSPVI